MSRESAHAGSGRDADIDAWYTDAMEVTEGAEDEGEGVVDILAAHDPADDLVDREAMSEALAESEVLRRAAVGPEED